MKVLIVEDSEIYRELITRVVQGADMASEAVATLAGAIDHLGHHSVDCVILDLALPDSRPPDTIRRLRKHYDGPLLVVSGSEQHCDTSEALLCKSVPLTSALVSRHIRAAIAEHQSTRHIRRRSFLPDRQTMSFIGSFASLACR